MIARLRCSRTRGTGKRFFYYPPTVSQIVAVPAAFPLPAKAQKEFDASAKRATKELVVRKDLQGTPSNTVDVVCAGCCPFFFFAHTFERPCTMSVLPRSRAISVLRLACCIGRAVSVLWLVCCLGRSDFGSLFARGCHVRW